MHANCNCSLPIELVRPIFQQIQDRRTLASLCLSSRRLYPEAQRMLYLSPLGLRPQPTQHMHFLTSLLHYPRLALLVQTYHVMFVTGSRREAFWTLVRAVLPTMVNLKEFSISGFSEDLGLLPMDRLVCQLEVLSWIQVDGGDAAVFTRWLDTQKALKELRWISRTPVEVSPKACPQLMSLEGNFRVMTALLPHRHIKRLYWISDIAFRGCHLAPLLAGLLVAGDLSSCEALSFEKHYHDAVDYRSLVDYFPSLASLELIEYGEEFMHGVQLPPNLRVLILSTQKGYGKKSFLPMAQRTAIVQKLFTKTSKLVRVDFAAQMVGTEVFYERWERGVRREGHVSSKDVLQEHRILLDKY
ncbi:hypothetical protein BJ912DRAFT_149233 [Pholiota molesta]|nr:hypothetical protein BJ912DRAFT_149233 [Pholiota molesta]